MALDLLMLVYGIVLFTDCSTKPVPDGRDALKKESGIVGDPTSTIQSYHVGYENSTTIHCTLEEICHCHESNDSLVADCSHLNIEYLPHFHPNVTAIHIQGNRIRNFSGEGVPKTVTYLDLSRNEMDTFIGFPFRDLKQLKYLDLSYNTLQYTNDIYSENIFLGLSDLRYLNLKHNNIDFFTLPNIHFPVGISKLNMLETLRLDGVDLLGFEEQFLKLTKLRILDLSGTNGVCHLGILKFDFFQNVSNIEILDISNCKIHKIDMGIFHALTNLHSLNISVNECLTFRVLANVTNDLQYTAIRILDISRLHCTFGPSTIIHRDDVMHLKNTNLTHVYMESNRLATLDIGVVGVLPKTLELISVKDNSMTFGLYETEFLSALSNIKVLHAENQKNSHNLESGSSDCNDWRAPASSHSTVSFDKSTELLECNRNPLLKLSHNSKIITKIFIPPSLTEVYYSNNAFSFEVGLLDFRENNLTMVDVSHNLLHSLKGPILSVPHIKHIDLSYNYCTYISDNFFMFQTTLDTLLLQHNLLGFILYKDVNGEIFKSLKSLKTLDLSANHIHAIPALLLKNQYELEMLNLSVNALTEFSLDLSQMKHLKYLDLRHNDLRMLKRNQREQIDSIRDTNLILNLEGNRMDCSCEALEFLKWLGRNKDMFEHYHTYKCAFSNGTEITFSNLDETLLEISKSCDSYIGIIAVFGSMILLSLSLVISGIVYRYRWKLRYLYYMVKIRYRGYTPVANADDNDDYIYDAFVSYCSDDYQFVREEVITHLEEEQGLRLCLHQRDFLPGKDIAENITDAIHQSRKSVVLLSRNYLNSYWCMYEFNMARMESIYSRGCESVLLIVFYEHIPARELPLRLMDLIESKSYIDYPHNDDHGKVVFWDTLATSISLYSTTTV
ncbi:toll-like receptor 4 [Pecten maximus]|uniref:toll-like receptor 4 n=1 Tax=Pecten maximus TaxID=6579 RepID=UPI001458BFA3|nr:toll-like receptor 4 [Pecten maximus]